ncbi:ribonucleotide-diphosphate reductase subunit beta [bacterium]|nr:ribonucleotide-diphosphate reductase subunit beta [bacterium]
MKDGKLLGNDTAGVNQILPHVNKWAWDLYKKGKNNNWMPEEIPMVKDIQNWKSDTVLSDDERLLIKRCLGFFAGSESLVGNNLFVLFKHITDPECRQYMARQMYEECLHNDTVVYICDSLDLDISEVYEAYQTVPSIKAKDDFLMNITENLNDITVNNKTDADIEEVIKAAFTYWIVCEGTFFFSGFAMLLAMSDKIPGIAEQIQYTLRDETIHIQFGTEVINQLKKQHANVWTDELQHELIDYVKRAVDLEIQYAKDVLPTGILGLNSDMFIDYMQFIANRRLSAVGLPFSYENASNPFPWLSETIDLSKQKNFFETKVTEYQNAGALADDF